MSYSWCLVVAALVCSVFFLWGKISVSEALLLLLAAWLNAANNLHLNIFLGRQRFKWFNFFAVLSPVFVLCFCTVFILGYHFSPAFYLFSLCGGWFLTFVISSFFLAKLQTKNSAAPLKAVFKMGFKFGIANQSGHVASLLNSRLLYVFLPAEILGVFSNAQALAEALLMVPGSFGQVLYSKSLSQRNATSKNYGLWRMLLVSTAITVAICISIFLIPDGFYTWIFGPNFIGIKPILSILAMGSIAQGGFLIFSYWQSSQSRFWLNFYPLLAGVLVNLALCSVFFYSKTLSVYNGSIALVMSQLAVFLLSLLFYKKTYQQID